MVLFFVLCSIFTIIGVSLLVLAAKINDEGCEIAGALVLALTIIIGWILIGCVAPVRTEHILIEKYTALKTDSCVFIAYRIDNSTKTITIDNDIYLYNNIDNKQFKLYKEIGHSPYGIHSYTKYKITKE